MTGRKFLTKREFWGTLIGAAFGPLDTVILQALGLSFEINGVDGSWLIAVYFGATFALLGYLLTAAYESRKRDAEQLSMLREQQEVIRQTRARLAQTEKLAALGQLATMIAHEVRNPLGVMRSSAQEIDDAVAHKTDAAKASSFIINEIDRLNHVIESILGFARPIQPNLTSVHVSELVEQARQLATEHPRSRDCRFSIDQGEDPLVEVDRDLVTQVLLDLIANALEASPPNGDIRIDVSGTDRIVIGISDSGRGIPENMRDKIFEPFYTTNHNGTGLGLAVSRQIVTSHSGSLEVTNSPQGGARFEVRLPARANQIAA